MQIIIINIRMPFKIKSSPIYRKFLGRVIGIDMFVLKRWVYKYFTVCTFLLPI